MFFNMPSGAAASAVFRSFIETVKASGLDLYKYLKYLLEQIPRTGGRYSCDLLERCR